MLDLPFGFALARPWALLALLGLVPLYGWHRRALRSGGRPFTAVFLLIGADGERGDRGRLKSPALFVARAVGLTALTLALAGPHHAARAPVVLATTPVEVPDAIVIRAGQPATVEREAGWPRVAGAPDWSGALALASRVAPGAPVRIASPEPDPIRAAGAALDGDAVVVSVTLDAGADGPPVVVAGDRRVALTERAGDWFHRGPLPAGPARIEAPGAEPWPICVPSTAPLRVADRGWPPAVEALLRVLPDVRRAPPADAVWRVGPAPIRHREPAPFAPEAVYFDFADDATRAAAPLWFADGLPPPGAIARRFRPLDASGRALLFAGDAVVVDEGAGADGAGRRFGFDPADTDLPATAGWPVLFVDALQGDRARRGRCTLHAAGRPLAIRSDVPVRLRHPRGATTTHLPVDGVVHLPAIDTRGLARLEAGGVVAHLAVRPPSVAPSPPKAVRAAPGSGRPVAGALVGLALLALVIGLWLGGVRRWAVAALLMAASALWSGRLPGGDPRPVAVLVQTGPSMPADETRSAAAAVVRALGDRPHRRLMTAPRPWRTPGELGPFDPSARDPLAELSAAPPAASGEGALILVSDGRDGLPRDFGVPVIAVPVAASRPDARVSRVEAVQLGEQVFVRATVVADRPGPARVTIGSGRPVTVTLAADRPQSVQAVLPAPPARVALERPRQIPVRVEMPDDRQPLNDVWPTPIAGERPPEAVVVGPGAAPWARAAGLRTLVVPAGSLAETGARLAQARAMFLLDQPAAALEPALVARLGRWVDAGGVLLLAGRAGAFGPGGWGGTPLDALSPLTADARPPGTGRLAVALVLDRSGSIAAEAGGVGVEALGALAGAVAAGLRADDSLAVIAFGGAVETLLPPTAVGALDGAVPAPTLARGGTRLAPALERARALLTDAPAEVRVIVAVGDGRVADGEAAIEAADALARDDVRVVFALAGADPDPAVAEAVARRTDGEVRRVEDGLALAVSAGIADAAAGAPTGGPVTAEAGWPGRVGGLPPPVEARVRVGARPGARVLARVAGEPLLAEWSVGQGRVIALATDRWALDAEQWSTLLAPATAPPPGDVQLTVEGDALVYRGPVAEAPPVGPVRIRDGRGVTTARWRASGPGEARVPVPPGPVELLEISAATARGAVVESVVRPPPATSGLDRGALELQAAVSGGRVVAPDEVPAALDALGIDRGWPWRPLGLALALALVLVETRRWSAGAVVSRQGR